MKAKQWFRKSFCGTAEPIDQRGKALRRATHFLNQNNLEPSDVKITEGLTSPVEENGRGYGAIYEVTVFYYACREMPYEDLKE